MAAAVPRRRSRRSRRRRRRRQRRCGRPTSSTCRRRQPSSTRCCELAKVTDDDVVYDLGCGDGRIPITAAQKYGARGVGIDIDPKRIEEANENAKAAGVTDNVTFLNQDLFESDFSDATVVTLYLLPSLNEKLMPKLQTELKPGTRIVSHAFTWATPGRRTNAAKSDGKTIYLWIDQVID